MIFTKYLPAPLQPLQNGTIVSHLTLGLLKLIDYNSQFLTWDAELLSPEGGETSFAAIEAVTPMKMYLCDTNFTIGDTVYNDHYHVYPNGWTLKNNTDVINANLLCGGDSHDPYETYRVLAETNMFIPERFHFYGMLGSIEYSKEDKVYHGKILEIPDLVTYEANSKTLLEIEFCEAVCDYILTKYDLDINDYIGYPARYEQLVQREQMPHLAALLTIIKEVKQKK